VSAQRARSAIEVDHRSAHPNIPGVPWWGAVLIAATLTAVGFAYDAGTGANKLSAVFAGCYVLGCVLAVLAVRQNGLFTAVIQPPLLLFVSVPTAYLLMTGSNVSNLRDTLINCAYPLIERFPLMFFTSAGVLLIGLLRWYVGTKGRRAAPAGDATGIAATLRSRLATLMPRTGSDRAAARTRTRERARTGERARARTRQTAEAAARRRSPAERAARGSRATTASARRTKSAERSAASRSRHTRPPETEIMPSAADRPWRPRRQGQPPAEPRRRSQPQRRVPPEHRSGYERPERSRRSDDRRYGDRYGDRYDDGLPLEPHSGNGSRNGSSRSRARSSRNGSTTNTHHPVSRVRYRGVDPDQDYRPQRSAREHDVESWEYDI